MGKIKQEIRARNLL